MSPLKLPYGITTAVAGILMHSKNTKERHHVLPATHKVGLVISSDLLVKAASSSDHQQPQKAFLENLWELVELVRNSAYLCLTTSNNNLLLNKTQHQGTVCYKEQNELSFYGGFVGVVGIHLGKSYIYFKMSSMVALMLSENNQNHMATNSFIQILFWIMGRPALLFQNLNSS